MKQAQLTDTFVMVRPDYFGYNPETALTNIFQHDPTLLGISEQQARDKALKEFQDMVDILKKNDLHILVLPSRKDVVTPDAVFPNNWFSHHEDNTLVLYPMLTPSRRAERQPEKLLHLLSTINTTPHLLDFSQSENKGNILEGTGSMVLDRVNKVAFAIEASRTTKELFLTWCQKMQYEPFLFHAHTDAKHPIYHTNMFMCIGEKFAVYCPESITDPEEKKKLEEKLRDLGKEMIAITIRQVLKFCGNMLQVVSTKGKRKIILSQTAFDAFTLEQKETLKKHGELIVVEIPIIEMVEGGGARCMLAEIFPPR